MAPRGSQAGLVNQNEGPSSVPILAELDTDRLAQGLAAWNGEGQETVKQILSSQTTLDITSASTVPISNSLIKILQSDVGAEEVVKCLQAVTETWDAEMKDTLWEALVDAVAVLSEAKDDSRDLNSVEPIEVDGQAVLHPADKGVQVVKSLLVSAPIACLISCGD